MNKKFFFKKIKTHRNIQDIGVEELRNIININNDLILIDVRSPLEYSEGHLNRCN